jgi:hypothetical protein
MTIIHAILRAYQVQLAKKKCIEVITDLNKQTYILCLIHFPANSAVLQITIKGICMMCHPKKKNSVVLVRKCTIPTEQPQPVGEVSANFS